MKREKTHKNLVINEQNLGGRAKKSLGQNFLNSEGALNEIVESGKVKKGDMVLEIGPGKGALTKKLLETGAKVFAVEKDDNLFILLQESFAEEIKSKQLTLIHADILDFDIENSEIKNYKLIANIPYNITGQILRKFVSGNSQPKLAVLLVQKEVAERITAKDGKESILSMSVKAYGTPKYIQTVKAGSFSPAPKVDSAILLIENISKNNFLTDEAAPLLETSERGGASSRNFSAEKYPCSKKGAANHVSEENFFTILKAGFAHKRKTISSNLKEFISKEKLAELGIKEKERAEKLSLDQWFEISSK